MNAADCAGRTPLHFAAANGRTQQARARALCLPRRTGSRTDACCQVRVLLAAGADVHARNCYGSTPLHMAAVASMRDAASVLLAAKADVNAVNNGGWTPLQYAIRGGEGFCDPHFVEWLVRAAMRTHAWRLLRRAAALRSQMKNGAVRTPQPLTCKLRDVFPHPAALAPHAHSIMQG